MTRRRGQSDMDMDQTPRPSGTRTRTDHAADMVSARRPGERSGVESSARHPGERSGVESSARHPGERSTRRPGVEQRAAPIYGWGTRLMIVLLTLLTFVYFCVQGYNYFADPFSTTLAYTYSVEESMDVSGYVVRTEQTLDDEPGAFVRMRRSEGERVSVGGIVATVYRDQDSLDMQTQMDTLSSRLEQLRYARESAMGVEVTSRLDSQIFANILQYASALSSDRLDRAEERGAQLRAQILKRDYTRDSPESIDEEITELEARLNLLNVQSARVARQITAPVSGLYSAVTDGYETIFTPQSVRNLKPSELAALVREGEEIGDSISMGTGKLVTGDAWYYIAVLTEKDIEQIERHIINGDALALRFSKGLERDFPVTLENVGPQENGRVTALFRCEKYLSEVTILRHQKAQIVFGTVTGLRVPKEALRLLPPESPSDTAETSGTTSDPSAAESSSGTTSDPSTAESLSDTAESPDTTAETSGTTPESSGPAAESPGNTTESPGNTTESPTDTLPESSTDTTAESAGGTWSITQTVTGPQTMGLYCVVGTEARFKPVKVLYTGENFLLVESDAPAGREQLRLRPGDEVIIQAEDLYDGKVVVSGG